MCSSQPWRHDLCQREGQATLPFYKQFMQKVSQNQNQMNGGFLQGSRRSSTELLKGCRDEVNKNLAWFFTQTHHWCLTCSWWWLVAKQLVKGSQTLVMDPTSPLQQSLVNTVHHTTMMVHWHLLGSGREFQDLKKIWPNFLATYHWCLTCSWRQSTLSRVVRPW